MYLSNRDMNLTWNHFIIQQRKACDIDEEDCVRKFQEPPTESPVDKVVFICVPMGTKVKTGIN